jgi:hypothetical protein
VKKIAIHGLPRSGTTWLGCILDSNPSVKYAFQPLFSYALKGFLDPQSDSRRIQEFFDELVQTKDPFINQQQAKESLLVPDFHKDESPCAVVYKEVRYHHVLANLFAQDAAVFGVFLIRSPIEVLNSWINAPKEFDPDWDVQREWRFAHSKNCDRPEEFYGFEKWIEGTKIFLDLQERYPERVICVPYEALKSGPEEVAKELFDRLGLDFHSQTKNFLRESQSSTNANAYSVYRQKDNQTKWKVEIPPSVSAEIRDRIKADKILRSTRL